MGEDESLLGGGRDDETSERQEVEEGENKETEEGPDGGWGWLVVLACFCTTFTLDGIGYSFGMFMKPLKKEMKEDNMEASSIGSLQIAVYLFSGPLVARLVSKFGARAVAITGSLLAALGLLGASLSSTLPVLMLSYSGVSGLGLGFLYIPGVVASQAHFTRRRALAVGIAVCGTGVGTLVLPPLVEWAILRWGWRGALQGLATLCLGSIAFGAAMFPAPNQAESSEEQEEVNSEQAELVACRGWRWLLSWLVGSSLASSPTLPLFLMVMLGDFLATMSLTIPYTFLPAMAVAQGISAQDAAFLISAAGISSTVGRVVAGLLCDQGRLHPMTITLLATTGASGQAFLLTACSKYIFFLLLSSGFGFCTGMWVACETPLIIRTLSFHLLTPAFGLLTAGGGLAALSGPPLAGGMSDITKGHPGITLIICATIMALSSIAYLAATVVRKRSSPRDGYVSIS